MNVTFVEYAQHDVDRDDRGGNKIRLRFQRVLKCLGRALKARDQRVGFSDFTLGGLYRRDGIPKRVTRRNIERQRRRRKDTLVVDRDWRNRIFDLGEHAHRYELTRGRRANVKMLQGTGVELELWIELKHDAVLV